MKRIFFFFALILSLAVQSQNLLDNEWKFSIGDNDFWKNPQFDDSGWKKIQGGIIWEEQGFPNYDGYAWYRKSLFISSKYKSEALINGGLSLCLGAIDDVDQTFFNGKLIGESGSMPPNLLSAYNKKRNYSIKTSDILWDKENLIAIRVYDSQGGGGLTSKEVSFKPQGAENWLKISAKFPVDNRVFVNPNKFTLRVNIQNTSNFDIKGNIEYTIISDFKDTINMWSKSLILPSHKEKILSIEPQSIKPGFYKLYIKIKSKDANITESYTFGADPEKIVSPADRPNDFEDFWMRAKRELGAVDPQYKLIHNDSLSTEKRDVYLVEMRSLDNVLIRGWYARPKTSGKYPGIVHFQGYSSNMQLAWGYPGDDMCVFVLNIRGHGSSRDEINSGFPGYLVSNIKDKERYIYRGAYMDCRRAIDFISSREEVDTRYVVVEGGSQGGALSLATAALNNDRVKLCIPSVPFLSDFSDYFKVATWPGYEFNQYAKKNPECEMNKILQTLRYFDVKNFAGWIKCPVFMSVGLLDEVCPPHTNFSSFNLLTVPKSYYVYPESGHGLPAESGPRKYEWMKKELLKLKLQNEN